IDLVPEMKLVRSSPTDYESVGCRRTFRYTSRSVYSGNKRQQETTACRAGVGSSRGMDGKCCRDPVSGHPHATVYPKRVAVADREYWHCRAPQNHTNRHARYECPHSVQ